VFRNASFLPSLSFSKKKSKKIMALVLKINTDGSHQVLGQKVGDSDLLNKLVLQGIEGAFLEVLYAEEEEQDEEHEDGGQDKLAVYGDEEGLLNRRPENLRVVSLLKVLRPSSFAVQMLPTVIYGPAVIVARSEQEQKKLLDACVSSSSSDERKIKISKKK
jgi:hypothetical protein